MNMRKPLPAECRDTVTGNAYYYGCVEELTWYLEEKSGWLAGIAMAACMIHVRSFVDSLKCLFHANGEIARGTRVRECSVKDNGKTQLLGSL